MKMNGKHLWHFSHCLGVVNGKHVQITKPPGSGSYFFNYKSFLSVIMLAIVNANYEFIMIDVGKNGRDVYKRQILCYFIMKLEN